MDRIFETGGLASMGGWLRKRAKKHVDFEVGQPCANCATALQGPWCYVCGQSAEDLHRSVWKLVLDALEGFFHADGRLWKTLPDLALKPGKLTRAYLDGHRAPQIPPFRMFLVVLLIVFFTGHAATSKKGHEGGSDKGSEFLVVDDDKEITKAAAEMRAGLGPVAADNFERSMREVKAKADARRAAAGHEPKGKAREGKAAEHGARSGPVISDNFTVNLDGKAGNNAAEEWLRVRIDAIRANPDRFALILEIWAHRVAILALPISALLMSLVYVFQRRFWVFDHLVFSMHSLSFQLLLLSVIFLLSMLVGPGAWWLVVLSPIHLYKHMRGTYGSSRFGTLLRMFVLWIGTVVAFSFLAILWLFLGANAMGGH